MARDWESTFIRWAQPPSATEATKIENAVRAVRTAVSSDTRLSASTLVYVQGSYRNRVNVRAESDVDIGVLYTGNLFGVAYSTGMTDADVGNSVSTYNYSEFKNALGTALTKHFGQGAVTRGDKAFDIHENTYRIDADVVPMIEHRRYSSDGTYICGVELHPDSGGRVVNWPERLYDNAVWPDQHYENGVEKNSRTGRRYKGLVRILKTLRNEMDDAGINAAKPLFGFFVECLAWNVPDWAVSNGTWDRDVQASLGYLWQATKSDESCKEWGEVSELKYLFRGAQTRQEAYAFVHAAWTYVGVRTT